ncbi:unnamed protein product, partial [Porites lobata]
LPKFFAAFFESLRKIEIGLLDEGLYLFLLDFDECNNGSHDCLSNATCINTAGYFECKCKDGYIGDGRNCTGKDQLKHICYIKLYLIGQGKNSNFKKKNYLLIYKRAKKKGPVEQRDCLWWQHGYLNWINEQFKRRFRVNRDTFNFILNAIEDLITKEVTIQRTGIARSPTWINYVNLCTPGNEITKGKLPKFFAAFFESLRKIEIGLLDEGLYLFLLDFDECNNGSHDCLSNATCINTAGYFECKCKDGYIGDGRNCTGKDQLKI